MGLMNKILLIISIFAVSFNCSLALAGYVGPTVIISGNWGEAANEFGIDGNGPYVDFPKIIRINNRGYIFIADKVNKRVKIYNMNGVQVAVINPKIAKIRFYWPGRMDCDSENNIYTSNYDRKLQKYSVNGGLQWEKDIKVDSINATVDDSVLIAGYKPKMKGKEVGVLFSSSGDLLKTYSEKPPELGIVESQSLGNGRYSTTIKYPDLTYTINRHDHDSYIRGCGNVLYGMSNRRVQMYDVNGELIDEFIKPEDKWKITRPAGGGFDERSEVIEQFGSPVIAPNGDIYCWKRTPDTYGILKWVWVEGPHAPEVLSAESSNDRLKVRWRPPAGKGKAKAIEKFEVIRSNDLCGPYQAIAKVDGDRFIYTDTDVRKGVVYFYRVRALQSSGASGYSNTLAGNVE